MIKPQTKMKRPKWSITTQFWAAVSIATLSCCLVFFISKKDIWTELEIIVGVLSVFTFVYFFYLFYHGIRFDRSEVYSIAWKRFNLDDSWIDALGYVDTGGMLASFGAEAGPLGCLLGLLLDIVASIFLIFIIVFLLWFGFNVFVTGTMILLFPLYFLFKRSLRVAVARAKTCHGDLNKSLTYAFAATAVNIVWLYLIIYAGHHIAFRLKYKS